MSTPQAWDQYQEALTQEFKLWFGAEDDNAVWHSFCRAVKIEAPRHLSCSGHLEAGSR